MLLNQCTEIIILLDPYNNSLRISMNHHQQYVLQQRMSVFREDATVDTTNLRPGYFIHIDLAFYNNPRSELLKYP